MSTSSAEPRTIDPQNPPADLRSGEVVRILGSGGRPIMKIDPATMRPTDVPAEFTVHVQPSGAAVAKRASMTAGRYRVRYKMQTQFWLYCACTDFVTAETAEAAVAIHQRAPRRRSVGVRRGEPGNGTAARRAHHRHQPVARQQPRGPTQREVEGVLILVSGATAALRRWTQPWIGQLVVPASNVGPVVLDGRPWALDNSAFTQFDEGRFTRMLARFQGVPGCTFCAAPDVVGNAVATAALFATWGERIRGMGYPVALVAQDGLTVGLTPWDDIDAIFIGGTTGWKLGPQARAIVAEANRRGKWTHMGRVNSVRRLRYAEAIGCRSVDGTGYSRFTDVMLGRAMRWAQQPPLALTGAL